MEENSFEKQVQQKMDELKIQPSDSVWGKIEAQIERKKSPKKGMIVFLLILLIMICGGYFFFNSQKQSSSKQIASEKNNIVNNKKSLPEENKINKNNTALLIDSSDRENAIAENYSQQQNKYNSAQRHKFSTNKKIHSAITGVQQSEIANEQSENLFQEVTKSPNEISGMENSVPGISSSVNKDSLNVRSESETADFEKINKDSARKIVAANNNDSLKQKQLGKNITKKSFNSKWKFGMTFSGGISSVKNSILSALGISDADKSADYLSYNTPAGGVPQTNNFQPSGIHSEFGFVAGAFAEKNISPKISVVAGINFKSFKTSNDVGRRINSTSIYSSQSLLYNTKYNNHFNFIEVPVSIKLQIGKGKALPLFWEGGVTISRLLNSNALQFDPSSGNYYNDNSAFNKTQLGLNTSISISLFSKHKTSVLIGPHFYYDATKIASKGLYNKKHFSFAGLKAEIMIGK
jgi:flagellar basal body-associated protein FliL